MGLLPRFVAPAGTALNAGDLMAWARGAARSPDRELQALTAAFRERYQIPHACFLSSGRAGMTVLLRVLAEMNPGRSEIVTAGYTCYSVAASAIRAGLKVRPVDVRAETLDYDPDALASIDAGRVVALTSSNLYGIPNDLPGLEHFASQRGVAFVDDAAQCLDGQVGGRWAGTFGDAGLFSFDKGKNITTLQGGVVVCRDDELAERLRHAFGSFPPPPSSQVALDGIKLLLYALLLRPRLYWIPNKLLTLGETPFELEYDTTAYSGRLAPLASRLLGRIDELTEGRIRNARALRERLEGVPGLTLPASEGRSARSVYPRFPLVLEDQRLRDPALASLQKAGIGATESYPQALVDVEEMREHLAEELADTPVARSVASGVVTLPTHRYLSDVDVGAVGQVFAAGIPGTRGHSEYRTVA
jgi:perosamine synthetase